MSRATTDAAFQEMLLAMFQLHGRVLAAADMLSGEAGLTGARWQVLKVTARQSLTVSQIARRLSLRRQSVQRTVDQLAGQRLVDLRPNMDHLRAGLVTISGRGRRTLAALETRQQAWLGHCLAGLDRSELEQLAGSLRTLADRVQAATEQEQPRRAPGSARRPRPAAVKLRRHAATRHSLTP